MASRWDELMVEYDSLGTREGQAQFITGRTGFSDECITRVLDQLITQPLFGEEWDFEAQARNAGLSFEEYAVSMSPLLRMSLEQARARQREIQARTARGEDPEFSNDEVEKVRKWSEIVETIARASGEAHKLVIPILLAVGALTIRQHELLQEMTRLKVSGNSPSGSTL